MFSRHTRRLVVSVPLGTLRTSPSAVRPLGCGLASHVMHFSTNTDLESTVHPDNLLQRIKKNATLSMTLGGASIVLYGISKIMLDVTTSFLSLTPAVSLYYGFVGGVVSAGIGAGLINLGYNASFVQPERVYKQALKLVSRHEEIKERLGGKPLTVIDTKSYNSVLGGWGINRGRVSWRQPTVIMSFVLKGTRAESVVTVLASRSMFQWHDTLLAVNVTYLDDNSTLKVVDSTMETVDERKIDEVNSALAEHRTDLEKFTQTVLKKYRNQS